MRKKDFVRIGAGAGYSGDRIDAAIELAKNGELDYLCFECLAERTIALPQLEKLKEPTLGYDPLLVTRMKAILPICAEKGIKIITNMGAANPKDAALLVRRIAQELELGALKIAYVQGDDVTQHFIEHSYPLIEQDGASEQLRNDMVSANAYIGAEPIVQALKEGADIVITGRVADPSLFSAPLIHEFGLSLSDYQTMGRLTVVGHLLECAGQVSGGYFADPGIKDVRNLAKLGFPFADVYSDGRIEISKTASSGGSITIQSCTEQLLYEIHNPASYFTPDVIADFSTVEFHQIAENRVQVLGGTGYIKPDSLKVSIGYKAGFIGEGQISYGGINAYQRAELAIDILKERLADYQFDDIRYDLIGINSLFPSTVMAELERREIRLRVCARSKDIGLARLVGNEVEALYTNGPAGGGGASKGVKTVVAVLSALLPRECVTPTVSFV